MGDVVFPADQGFGRRKCGEDIIGNGRLGAGGANPRLTTAPLVILEHCCRRVLESHFRPFLEDSRVVLEWDEVGPACFDDPACQPLLGVGGVQRD